ncbi:MAG: hypothetical protein H7Y03_01205, partial [Chitinophagaceae bacterium]|nr:hypothetical protein [Chitinophagaceae bacterium]
AGFIHDFFPSSGIAINDIGAIVFFNDNVHILDMEGLATNDVLRIKKNLHPAYLRKYVENNKIEIGIFYPHLYVGKIPPEWELVGTWTLTDNYIAGGSVVGFYVINPALKSRLIQSLQSYKNYLPGNVKQEGIYLKE